MQFEISILFLFLMLKLEVFMVYMTYVRFTLDSVYLCCKQASLGRLTLTNSLLYIYPGPARTHVSQLTTQHSYMDVSNKLVHISATPFPFLQSMSTSAT